MLPFSTHNYFAQKQSPEGERRLLYISNRSGSSGQNAEGTPKRAGTSPEESSREGREISGIAANVHTGINAGILAHEEIDAVLRQPSGLIALLEYENNDLRRQVEQRMRAENAEYYAGREYHKHLPLHEILWYLRDHEEVAAILREEAVERLRDPAVLLHFTNSLEGQIQKLQDIEESLSDANVGLRLGSIDIARLRETEQWLREQCIQHSIAVADPLLTDWMAGRYADFQPDRSEVLRVITYISGKEESLPEQVSIDTTGAPDSERLRERLDRRIYEEYRGENDDTNAVLTQEGKPTRMHWVQCFRSAVQTLRKRKLFGMFLNRGTVADEDEFAAHSLHEQIDILQRQLIEMRTVLQEDIKQRATLVHNRLDERIRQQFGDTDSTTALARFGASQSLLGGRVIAGVMQPLERMMFDPPSPESPAFQRYAEDSYNTLEDYVEDDVLSQELEAAKLDHQDTIVWALHLEESGHIEGALQALQSGESHLVQQMPAGTANLLQHFLHKLHRIAHNQATGDDFDEVEQEIGGKAGKQHLNLLFYTLSNANFRQRAEQADAQCTSMEMTNSEAERERVLRAYEEVKERFTDHPALKHTVCRVLHIEDGLREHYAKVRVNLAAARKREGTTEGAALLKSAHDTVQRLTDAEKQLRNVTIRRCQTPQEFSNLGPGTTEGAAFYNRETGEILVNAQYIQTHGRDEEADIHHEMGHAALDILTRRTGLFEGLLIRTSELLDAIIPSEQLPGQERTFRELLEKQTGKWKVDHNWPIVLKRAQREVGNTPQAEALAIERYHDLLIDELLNKYADWVERGKPIDSSDPEQVALFRHLENVMEPKEDPQLDARALEHADLGEDKQHIAEGLFQVGDDEYEDDTSEDTPQEGDESTEIVILDINTKLIDLRRDIEKLRVFYESYPEYRGELKPLYDNYDQMHHLVQERFQEGETTPENAKKAIEYIQGKLGKLIENIQEIKIEKANTAKVGPGGRKGWRALFQDIQFVSIMDIVHMFKQGWEDLNRYWQRRGEAKQASLGHTLAKLIPKGTPYFGRLQDEFLRRDKESEQKEVNEWKEKLDEFDSYDLLEMLGKIRNKDQVKAIFIILTERGRMDWNDKGIWQTLNALSIFNMPIHACEHDDILRDKWIHKLISDIWGDRDLYTKWRQTNDGAVSSGKKNFTATVDQLSNVSGGLDAELKNQLMLWDDKQQGRGTSPDLNPHLYEEILEYAMRNGKMTMEGKLFYLVKGVACGLLSIDRLRALAGETGGILNQYPWIDYFYQKNNSLPEVKALAKRLEEPGKPYDYGPRTTLWLHLEVMRVESTRQRISKAISGMRAENLDHEDIPTLVAQADWVNIDRLTGMVSGTREKLSPEAVRNTYTGFGTKFKALARLVQMEEDGLARFTDRDLSEAAKAIVAYIHMDNIFTRNASRGDRPELTWDVIDNGIGPSTGGLTVSKYRTPQNEFVFNVVKESGFVFPPIRDKKGRTHPPTVQENFIRREDEAQHISIRTQYTTNEQEERYEEMKNAMKALQAHLMTQPDIVKSTLKKYANRFLEENYARQPGTPDKEQYLSTERVRDYFEARFSGRA